MAVRRKAMDAEPEEPITKPVKLSSKELSVIIQKVENAIAELRGHTAQDNSAEIALLEEIRADLLEL